MANRQRPQQNRADQTEDNRVASNPQSQREQRHKCESRASPQLPSSESHVLPESFHDSSAPHVPAHIFDISRISKMLLRALSRLLRRHSAPDVLFRPQINVKLPLFRDLAMHFLAMPYSAQSHPESLKPPHSLLLQTVRSPFPTAIDSSD